MDNTRIESITRSSSGNGCTFTVAPKGYNEADPADRLPPSLQGDTTFTIRFTSSRAGSPILDVEFTIYIGPDSNIIYTAPPTTGRGSLTVASNQTLEIDASDYATDGDYTISCGTATNIAANVPTSSTVALASVVRDPSGNGCSYTIMPTATQGTATFTIPYTSSGGDTANGNISITVGPPSDPIVTPPTGLSVARNRTLEINALDHVTEDEAYTVTCDDATGVDANRMTVTRSSSGNGCTFTVAPKGYNEPNAADRLAPSLQGDTTFSVLFTSSGGATTTGTFTINIGPDAPIDVPSPIPAFICRAEPDFDYQRFGL